MFVRHCRIGIFLLAGLVGACGLETDRDIAYGRADRYVGAHPELNPGIAVAISRLELADGMTPEQVAAAWGGPVIVQKSIKGISEMWYFPCLYPHFCLSGGRRSARHEEDRYQSRAFFVEGILTEWQY